MQFSNGDKRYYDETFHFEDQNSIILLENGGGKTVFIQTALQAIIPHSSLGDRTIKETLYLENGPAHIAIEWTVNNHPKRSVVTAVTLYRKNNAIESLRYVYEYGEQDEHRIENIPFLLGEGQERYVATKEQMLQYYQNIVKTSPARGKLFLKTLKQYREYLEETYAIMRKEWENISMMNSTEGGIEKVFENCKTTQELFDRLLIPSVEQANVHFEKKEFVDQFESQRKSLRKSKELAEQIKSYKKIDEQLNEYVTQYAHYDEAAKRYYDKKVETVLYYTYLENQKKKSIKEIEKIKERIKGIEEEQREGEALKKRIQIYELQESLTEEQEQYQKCEQKLYEIEEQLKEHEHQKYALLYAKNHAAAREAEQLIREAEEQMRREDEQFDMEQLTEQLQQLEGQLLFLLEREYHMYEEKRQQLNKQLTQTQKERKQFEREFRTATAQLQTINNEKTASEVREEKELEEAKRLKKGLVAHPNDKVEQLLKEWKARLTTLANQIHEMEQERQQIEKEQTANNDRLEEINRAYQTLQLNQTSTNEQLNMLEREEAKLKEQLQTVIVHIPVEEKIYQKEQTIREQLQNKIQVLEKNKRECLMEERRVLRQIDDYEEQELFFADAYVAKKLEQWSSRFSSIQTGTQFVNYLSSPSEQTSDYPFWANCLITIEQERDQLQYELNLIEQQLTIPIIVLSRAEAMQIYKGEVEVPKEWTIPSSWRTHIQREQFEEWKHTAREAANNVIMKREQIEKNIEKHKRVDHEFQNFLEKYPYEQYEQLKRAQFEQQQKMQQLHDERIQMIEDKEKLERELENHHTRLYHSKEESRTLAEQKIPKATDYMRAMKRAQFYHDQLEQLTENLKRQEQEVKEIEQKREQVINHMQTIETDLQKLEYVIQHEIETHPIYKRKDELVPRMTSNSEKVISEKIKAIDNRRNQISQNIQVYEQKIAYERKNYEQALVALNQILEQCPEVRRDLPVYKNIKRQIEMEQERIRVKTIEKEEKMQKSRTILEKIRGIEGQLSVHIDSYEGNVPKQTESIARLKEKYETTMQRLQEQLVYEEQLLSQEEEQYEKMQRAYEEMQRFYYAHELNKITIQTEVLPPSAYTSFSYEWLKVIVQLKRQLIQLQREETERQKQIKREKDRFLRFSETIIDPRMKKEVVQGVERNTTYEALMKHRQQVQKRLEQATYTAEQTMQGHDQDLQQIIQYVIRALDLIRADLLEIPKRTKVPIANIEKTIFQFRIPEWQREEAIEKIYNYFLALEDQLKKSQFLDESGQESPTIVRKYLEKKLQMTALLRIVLDNQVMQVKCRKVQSIDQVSSTYYSWEQSNKWSGGEQWSKNMALYLGLLRYIAEKSGKRASLKRDRVLLLDNPFGKASSEHVLQPVFYIAEKLGFQIIALTAHGENKFVTDYFPVRYSCRSRSAIDHTHEVMELKTLYFEDHQWPHVEQQMKEEIKENKSN